MARRKRSRAEAQPPGAPLANEPAASPRSARLAGEAGGAALVLVFAVMMFLAPALGVPHEEMLQDTLKSIIVSFTVLGAGLLFLWQQRARHEPLRWHAILWLPLALMAYALGSMAWSHTYLGGVEAVRWFIFSLLLWLGLNSLSRERLPALAWGIHCGAVAASLWTALQFWADLRLFPQGPNPASTFINRNFFAEFAVSTLPFSAMLIARTRQSAPAALLAASTGLVITAVLMTGTRSALIALWLQLLVVFPLIVWLYRDRLALGGWDRATRAITVGVLVGTVAGLGLIPTGNAKIAEEGRGMNALERGYKRTGSISPNDTSLGVRMVMWKATINMIEHRPLSGVGAGAWEVDIPLYQAEGSQLETDYYVHNEILQLLAEYGVVGWAFLLALLAYLSHAAWRTVKDRSAAMAAEAPWRAVLLCSLLAFLIVSNVGFPWRMATTGALFALCLAALAASDSRLPDPPRWTARALPWRPSWSHAVAGLVLCATGLAVFITQRAMESEQKIVRAAKMALTISLSPNPNDPKWNAYKTDLLKLIREGVALNPHYRKITPMVADELARWGDWKNATWVWESVLSSRPYVVAIMANVARGYANMGQPEKAREIMELARGIQPRAPAVRSLEVILLSRSGQEARALELAREAIRENLQDFDLCNAAAYLATRAGDYALAAKALELRIAGWPASQVQGYVQLGNLYANSAKEPEKALAAFKQALALAKPEERSGLLTSIPNTYWPQLGVAPPAPQTSASKG